MSTIKLKLSKTQFDAITKTLDSGGNGVKDAKIEYIGYASDCLARYGEMKDGKYLNPSM